MTCRRTFRAITRIIESEGGEFIDYRVTGGGHAEITWLKDGAQKRSVFQLSTLDGNPRGWKNTRALIRRVNREEAPCHIHGEISAT